MIQHLILGVIWLYFPFGEADREHATPFPAPCPHTPALKVGDTCASARKPLRISMGPSEINSEHGGRGGNMGGEGVVTLAVPRYDIYMFLTHCEVKEPM